MFPRWSSLFTLLLSLPGMALAQDLPGERAVPRGAEVREEAPTPTAGGESPAFEARDVGAAEPVGPELDTDAPAVTGVPPDVATGETTEDVVGDAQRAEDRPSGSTGPRVNVSSDAEKQGQHLLHRVELIDGQVLTGILRSRDAHGVMLEIGDGPRIYLSRSTIAKVSTEAPAAERPLRPQSYFLAPSALLLKEGQGSFAQLELLLSEFSYGITDNLNFSIGSFLPFWFANAGEGFNMLAMVKGGGSINEMLHLAVGAYGIFVPAALNPNIAVLGVGFGSVTLGTPDRNLSVSLGIPAAVSGEVEGIIFNLSGMIRVSRVVALTSEIWSFPTGGSPFNAWAWGSGTRLDLRPFSIDVGVVVMGQGGALVPIPLPWISAAYNFG